MLLNVALLALAGSAIAARRSQLSFGNSLAELERMPAVSLPTYEWLTSAGIVPSPRARYTLAELQSVARDTFGEEAVWRCVGGSLSDVFWSDETTLKSSCPESGIKWLPQLEVVDGPSPPTGEIILSIINVTTGVTTGCLGEGGMWSLGACASFNVTSVNETAPPFGSFVPNNFTLTTVKGVCSGEKGVFACKNTTTVVPSYFQADLQTSLLIFNGTTEFYAPLVPLIPWMRIPILTKPKLTTVNVSIQYSAAPPPAV